MASNRSVNKITVDEHKNVLKFFNRNQASSGQHGGILPQSVTGLDCIRSGESDERPAQGLDSLIRVWSRVWLVLRHDFDSMNRALSRVHAV